MKLLLPGGAVLPGKFPPSLSLALAPLTVLPLHRPLQAAQPTGARSAKSCLPPGTWWPRQSSKNFVGGC